jgi:hypothetical protein
VSAARLELSSVAVDVSSVERPQVHQVVDEVLASLAPVQMIVASLTHGDMLRRVKD